MRTVRTEDSKYEKLLRDFISANGYNEDSNRGSLGFRPDIVLVDEAVAIFVHGCFWHRHSGCKRAYEVDTDKYPSWPQKFEKNVERDKRQIAELLSCGWRVLVVWECGLNAKKRQRKYLPQVLNWIEGTEDFHEIPAEPPLSK